MAETLSAQQRANLFSMSTRQNLQMIAKKSVTTPNTSIEFSLPKARLLSNIFLKVKAKVKVKHASLTTIACDSLAPHRLIRRYSVDLNNGFQPWSISGEGAYILSLIQPNANMCIEKSAYTGGETELKASASGTSNELFFTIQLPVTINQRDPVGLILLQSDTTIVDLRVDVGNPADMIPNAAGFTFELENVEIEPMLETFSIPQNESAMPDLSVLKLAQDRVDTITSAGQQEIKLSTGTIYRKLALYVTDENGVPSNDMLTGNIDLVFNTADCNYSVSPEMLRAKNAFDLGHATPDGVYIFDFSNQGVPNFGGVRDYIDTAKLSYFTTKLATTGAGKVKVITECLARLA